MKRQVTIKPINGAWLVLYCNRQKGQRYCAGQFDARTSNYAQVIAWISKQPNLILLPSIIDIQYFQYNETLSAASNLNISATNTATT